MESSPAPLLEARKDSIQKALDALLRAKASGSGLLVLTGAGMSVASGVPVFRHADGSMSEDFLRFLRNYNRARERHGLQPADDWFQFSVPEMFRHETAREAWAYWRWRILRARVPPWEDYQQLDRIMNCFGKENCFVITSNCDGLHRTFLEASRQIHEIHGSLSKLQCSGSCTEELWNADEKFIERLEKEPEWVPMCPKCNSRCLRPNVVIFGDDSIVYSALREQSNNLDAFLWTFKKQIVVVEIGAGVVVPSIRYMAEEHARGISSIGLVRINPSEDECETVNDELQRRGKYWPIVAKSIDALRSLADGMEAASK